MSSIVTETDVGAGLSVVNGQLEVNPLVAATTQVYHEKFAGGSNNGVASGAWARNSTVVNTGNGRWTVTFDSSHPDGEEYHPSLAIHESGTLRDVPKISIVEGSKTPQGFQIQLTVDDNGGSADAYNAAQWSYGVDCPIDVMTSVMVAP